MNVKYRGTFKSNMLRKHPKNHWRAYLAYDMWSQKFNVKLRNVILLKYEGFTPKKLGIGVYRKPKEALFFSKS